MMMWSPSTTVCLYNSSSLRKARIPEAALLAFDSNRLPLYSSSDQKMRWNGGSLNHFERFLPTSPELEKKRTSTSTWYCFCCCCSFRVMCCICIFMIIVARLLITPKNSTMFEDFLINQEILPPRTKWDRMPGRSATVRQGLSVMRASNVTFIGIARDIGPHLIKVLPQLENLAKEFKYSRAIVVEEQSVDNTAEILQQWAAVSPNNRTVLLHYFYDHHEQIGFFKGRKMPREGRLAASRNEALRTMHRMPDKTDYVIVVDLDIVGFDPNGVADSFARRGSSMQWDVICANGIMMHGTYRDTFAFRTDKWNNTNIHWWDHEPHDLYNLTQHDKDQLKKEYDMTLHSARLMLENNILSNIHTKGLQRVRSCFGGLAIYKYNAFRDCQYEYRHSVPPYMLDCEHVLLHQCMIEKHQANIYTNTAMKLWYGHGLGGGAISYEKIVKIFNL